MAARALLPVHRPQTRPQPDDLLPDLFAGKLEQSRGAHNHEITFKANPQNNTTLIFPYRKRRVAAVTKIKEYRTRTHIFPATPNPPTRLIANTVGVSIGTVKVFVQSVMRYEVTTDIQNKTRSLEVPVTNEATRINYVRSGKSVIGILKSGTRRTGEEQDKNTHPTAYDTAEGLHSISTLPKTSTKEPKCS